MLAYGLGGVEDLVLRACLERQAYDAQCEGHRAAWLYEMVKLSAAPAYFSDAIVAALRAPDDDCYINQICELASLMGRDGDMLAASALRDFIWSQTDRVEGGHAIVALDGIPAAVRLSRSLGSYLQQNPGAYVDRLDDLMEGGGLFDAAFAELKRQAEADAQIAVYVNHELQRIADYALGASLSDEQKAARKEEYRNEILREYPLERLFAEASAPRSASTYMFRRFGRWADAEDVERVLEQLRVEENPDACLRLLLILAHAKLPRLDARVWALAHDSRADLRVAAVAALASLKDPMVGELARQRLRDDAFSAEYAAEIELFTHNYHEGDEALILSAIERLSPDDDQMHRLGTSVQQVCEENDTPALAGLAIWNYYSNPCTICRKYCVDLLLQWNGLPAAIANECQYDASIDVRERVKT